jgi:hypothetical protein
MEKVSLTSTNGKQSWTTPMSRLFPTAALNGGQV